MWSLADEWSNICIAIVHAGTTVVIKVEKYREFFFFAFFLLVDVFFNIQFSVCAGCDMCADNRNGECPMHGPLHSLRRLVGTSGSAAPVTLPDVPDWLRDLPREVGLRSMSMKNRKRR